MRSVLYYPTINVPNAWLRKALLYWDEVSSIVPESIAESIFLSPEYQLLREEKVLVPAYPGRLLDRDRDVQDLQDELKATVESQEFKAHLGLKAEWRYDAKIHDDKLTTGLIHFLRGKELLKEPLPSEREWFRFENKTAKLYMSLLAKYLADIEHQKEVVPSTDEDYYRDLNYSKKRDSRGFECAQIVMSKIVPVPRSTVSIEEILKFKRGHNNELMKFRQKVDEFQRMLVTAESKRELHDAGERFREEIQVGVNDLAANLREARISIALSSLDSLLNITSPFLLGVAASILEQVFGVGGIPINVTMGTTAIAGGIKLGKYFVDQRNQKRATLRKSPFSYVYSASELT